MHFHPFEVSIPHIIYAALGAFVVFFGMFSLFIREKLYIGEACWAFLFGVVIGPYGANIFDPRSWGNGNHETTNTITLEFTRVVLAIGVFAIGVELPKAYMARHWKSLMFLLGPIMTWGWFVSAALIYALIPGLNFLSSLAVAACLTPTDPILAAAVVGGKYADKHVPAHLRHLLAAESGCNDGAAYPFLWIALYLIIDPSTGRAVSDWFLLLWLYQVILGIVFGACLGIGFRYLMRFCERKDLIDRQSYVAQYVSLAMLTIGSCTLLGTDDLLAAFSCGAAFAWDGFFNKQTEEAVFSSVIDLLFNIAAFVFVGAWMPFNSFSDATLSLSVWRLIVIALLVMILRRLPIMIALYKWIPDVKTFREAIFSGHFGPMGVGAIFISTLAAEQLPEAHDPPENQQQLLAATIQPIVAFMVLCSILIHGLSIPFFSLGRRVHSVSRTWSRHDTLSRNQVPEWANLTRPTIRGQHIEINRDLERGELTVQGDETPTTEKVGSTSSQTQNGDYREESPPDGTDTVIEWKEGPHNIVERRAGPGEEVEVEVQENAFGPHETNVRTLRVAEDAVHDTINDIRNKLADTFASTHKSIDHATRNVQEGAHHEAQQAGEALHNIEDKAKDALSPTSSRQQNEDDDEGWLSDREGEQQGEDAAVDPRRKHSKIKPPKAAVLRPAGSKRRRSIRSGMLGARVAKHPSPDSLPRIRTQEASVEDLNDPDSEPERERGRRPPVSSSSTPASPLSSRPHHARIDSLRSLDTHSRRSLREASPARSIRWADRPDPDDEHRLSLGHHRSNSGASTPRVLSPSAGASPLPGASAAASENEAESGSGEDGVASSPSPAQVRFSIPEGVHEHGHARS